MKCTSIVGLLIALLTFPLGSAQAQGAAERDEARELARQGIEALEAGRHQEALDKLGQAEEKFHAPTHLLYMARALAGMGKLVEAHERYVDVLVEDIPNYAPPAFHEARRTAGSEATALAPKIAALRITVSGAGAERASVSVDGEEMPRARLDHPVAVEPGVHRVQASVPGGAPVSGEVEATIGQIAAVLLTLGAGAAPEPSPAAADGDAGEEPASAFPIGAGVALGIGGAALVAGIVTGVLTLSRADEIRERCQENLCPPEQETVADDAKVLGNVATAMFAIAGAGVALGAVLLIVDAADQQEAHGKPLRVTAEVGPTGVLLRGSF